MAAFTEYELFVRGVMQTLLRAQGFADVVVEHNVTITGLSRAHQIDVYWQYRLAGVEHRVIVDCKNYKRPVTVETVTALKGVLADYPNAVGVIVTTSGFQTGAIAYARMHGIGLKVIRHDGSVPHVQSGAASPTELQ